MGIISRWIDRRIEKLVESRATKFAAPVHPQDPVVAQIFGQSANTAAGVTIDESTAMAVAAVYACIRDISEDVAKLPLFLYRRLQPRGKEEASSHPLWPVLHDAPNEEMSSFGFRETVTGWCLSWGNGYAEIVRDGGGSAVQLVPLPSNAVQPDRVPSDNRLIYLYDEDAKHRVLEAADVLHLRGLGGDGIVGWSPLRAGRESVGLASGAEQYAARFFSNDARPGGVLQHPGTLTDKAYNRLKESQAERHGGLENAHKTLILEEDMKWQSVGIPAEDAQLLQTRMFSVEEIARFYRMPPHKIQHLQRATYSNIETLTIEYVTDTLMPWLVRWEQEIKRKILRGDEYFAEHLITGLLRGDQQSRADYYRKMFSIGAMSQDDIRERENMNPLPDDAGQVYYVPLNMAPAGTIPDGGAGAVDGSATPDEEDGGRPPRRGRLAAFAAVHVPLIADAVSRIQKIEIDRVRKGRRKCHTLTRFRAWAEEFYREHLPHFRAAIGAAMDAAAESFWIICTDEPWEDEQREAVCGLTDKIATEFCEDAVRDLGSETPVSEILMYWNKNRANAVASQAVDEILTLVEELTDGH
jgi:HK97 family phage portal protein